MVQFSSELVGFGGPLAMNLGLAATVVAMVAGVGGAEPQVFLNGVAQAWPCLQRDDTTWVNAEAAVSSLGGKLDPGPAVCVGDRCTLLARDELQEVNGKTYASVRALAGAIGLQVGYDMDLQAVHLSSSGAEALSARVGQPAPDFTLPDLDGNPVSLSGFRGRTVVWYNWASW